MNNIRFEFVRHLFPEAQTVLICDQADFKAIMNFLFFSISVCLDERFVAASLVVYALCIFICVNIFLVSRN